MPRHLSLPKTLPPEFIPNKNGIERGKTHGTRWVEISRGMRLSPWLPCLSSKRPSRYHSPGHGRFSE